ncbi:hypothetical protein VM1G_09407 [Cytospora mali]|uniref:F-box domain-containing protein n=1 Tax=Cytospora mali TaxID=578113 RepID=A0A194WC13_CYTMA|nr:hypothetical protein VM1G_09407 [Valsa mali]
MTNARNVLRDFDLAGPAEREEIIRGLVDRISVGEAECLAKARHKCDMFGHDQMPLEIRLMIIHYLDITDFYNCALLVCRKWKVLLMGSKVLAEDVLHTWFPCLYDKDMPEEDMMELFSQTILKRYLRDTGRFQYRMTCSFATNSNAEHPKSRIEGLQKGHTFKDLTCSAWLHTRTPTLPVASMALDQHFKISYAAVTKESIVTMCLYSDYRLAWQMGGSDPGSSVIYFHNLHEMHTQKPSSFRLSGQLILGLKLKLEALGDYLIVASVVGQRKLYARDLQTHTDDSVILPAALYSCITQGELVLIVTVNGDLLLWTFLRGLVQIDTAARPKNQQAHREMPAPIMGIVRYQDISRAYPHAADFVSESGLLYMCSFYGGGCSFNSSHTDCTWYSPAAQSNDVFTPKIRSTRHYGYDSGPGDDEAWKSIEAEAIFGDDEFLILITNRGLYTVFAVDADRGMAKVLKRTQETKRTIWQ